MWRAEQFVLSLERAGFLRASPRVFVVGLGPTGMTVAKSLLDRGAKVVACNVVESAETLRLCTTRVLCPTTFDWPSPDWHVRDGSCSAGSRLIPWHAAIAWNVHRELVLAFGKAVSEYYVRGQFKRFEPARWHGIELSPTEITVTIQNFDNDKPDVEIVDLVVVCAGPARSLSHIPAAHGEFCGFSFWSNDDPLFHIPHKPHCCRVAILGGQDGGLIDFARLLTGIADTWEALDELDLTNRQLARIGELNRQMWDAFGNGNVQSDHLAFVRLQEESIDCINAMWSEGASLRTSVGRLLLPREYRPDVQLVVDCHHFGLAYFANRILAHFLARALMACGRIGANGGLMPFRVGVRGALAECLDGGSCPRCLNGEIRSDDAMQSAGHRHRLHFIERTCQSGVEEPPFLRRCMSGDRWMHTVTTSAEPYEFDRIVLRLGADPESVDLPPTIRDAVKLLIEKKPLIRHVPPFYVAE